MTIKIDKIIGDDLPDALLELAKLVYQLCVKHGKEYISVCGLHSEEHESGHSTVDLCDKGLTNLWYSPEEDAP